MARKKRKREQPRISQPDQRKSRDVEELEYAYKLLEQELQIARTEAERRSSERSLPLDATLDLRGAGRILDEYPKLAQYLAEMQDRERIAFAAKTSPTGYPSAAGTARSDATTLGGWAGISAPGSNANNPIGVHNARQLRQWADADEWVNSAINFLAQKVARADVAVMPQDERKPYNRNLLKGVQLVLDQPNELRDTWPMQLGMFVRDLLTIGLGVFTKNMTVGTRRPVALYCEDAANVKIYPAWSGDPDEPRYVYQAGSGDWGIASGLQQAIPLRNDEAIVVPFNPTTFRFGWSPVQVLADTIEADLKASAAGRHLVDFHSPPHLIDFKGASELQIRALRSTYENDVMGRKEILFTGSPNGVQISPLVFSAKDNQFLEWQEYLCRKICAVFQISPQDLGVTLDINKATGSVQQDISDSKGYLPLLLLIEEYLNREFLADFAPKMPGGRSNLQALNLRIIFPEVSEAARQMHAERVTAMAAVGLSGLPAFTPNQMLAMRGEEPVRGGNTFWAPTTNGPMPWLSYDGDFGDYLPLGTQDSSGGPADSDDSVGADGSSDDDMSGSGDQGDTTSAPTGQDTTGSPEAPGTAPTTPTGDTGVAPAAPSGDVGAATSGKSFKKALPRSYGWTGAMVAFFLDPDLAQQLAQIVGAALKPCCQPELAGDLHCTLGYLGDTANDPWSSEKVASVCSTLALFAQQQQQLTGVIGGIGRFNAPAGEPTPLYASVDAPMLPVFREDLLTCLANLGLVPSMAHGYSPHITLAYLNPEEAMPLDEIPAFPLLFTGLTLSVGDARYTFPLAEPVSPYALPAAKRKTAAPIDRGGRWIDTRSPGKPWTPGNAVWVREKTLPALAQKKTEIHDEATARAMLSAAVTRVFADVAARGHQQIEHRKGERV